MFYFSKIIFTKFGYKTIDDVGIALNKANASFTLGSSGVYDTYIKDALEFEAVLKTARRYWLSNEDDVRLIIEDNDKRRYGVRVNEIQDGKFA